MSVSATCLSSGAAGEVIDKSVMACLEYGAEHLDIPLLIVMGHESCGAVQAAVESTAVEGPNLQYLVKAIRAGTDRSPSERKELRGACDPRQRRTGHQRRHGR
jgi:carbonic anhydrase